jgi:hypothetical protein
VVLLVLTVLALQWTTVGISGVGQAVGASDTARVLVGTIDIHVHHLPDDRPRSIDAIDVAKLASSRGMRAIVLKNHYESTAGLAYLVRKVVPGIEVFGGIDLNLTVGGINPAAVEHMTRVTGGWGRFVWMPTFDAENQVRYSKENRPFVSVSSNGELLPAVKEVIGLIAEARACTRDRSLGFDGGTSAAPRGPPPRRSAHGGHPRDECPRAHGCSSDAGGRETRRIH